MTPWNELSRLDKLSEIWRMLLNCFWYGQGIEAFNREGKFVFFRNKE